MKFIEYKVGMLVQPLVEVKAKHTAITGREQLAFKEGMLGIVMDAHKVNGVLVSYFDPISGMVETARVSALMKVEWPSHLPDLELISQDKQVFKHYMISRSMDFLAAKAYLRAIYTLRPEYLRSLNVNTLRIPGVHIRKARAFVEDEPVAFYRALLKEVEGMLGEFNDFLIAPKEKAA